jgi:hypothetical protein
MAEVNARRLHSFQRAFPSSTLKQKHREPDVSVQSSPMQQGEPTMGRYLLLWLLGIPIPILVLIWMFGGLH